MLPRAGQSVLLSGGTVLDDPVEAGQRLERHVAVALGEVSLHDVSVTVALRRQRSLGTRHRRQHAEQEHQPHFRRLAPTRLKSIRDNINTECSGFFHCGPGPHGRERGGVLGVGQQPRLPPTKGSGERCELRHRGSGWSPDRPKVFHYFQHSWLSPGTIILLIIVDYHAAVGGGDHRAPFAHGPGQMFFINHHITDYAFYIFHVQVS